jgi:hypothetical protein
MAFLFFCQGASAMNAARPERAMPLKPTHTLWPAGRRLDPAPSPAALSAAGTSVPGLVDPKADNRDDEHQAEEPGYGHGV